MKEYLKNVSKTSEEAGKGEGLWARLRRDLGDQQPPKEERKPFGGQNNTNNNNGNNNTNRDPNRPRPPPRTPRVEGEYRPRYQNNNQQQQSVAAPGASSNASSTNQGSNNSGTETASAEKRWKRPGGNNNKVWNNRLPNKKGGADKSAESGVGGAVFAEMGGDRSKGGRRSRRDNDDGDNDRRENSYDKIPPTIQPLLFDHEFFAQKAAAGNAVDDSKMDPLDALMADAFMDSFKSGNGTYQTYLQSSKSSRVVIPKPRSSVQLQYSMLPPVTCQPNTPAYALAESAWGVIQKNFYYNDRQRLQMVSGIAANMVGLQAVLDKTDVSTVDMVFDPTFRKGIPGIERENRERMLSQVVVRDDDGLEKGETDWGVNAVEDEDQL